MTDDGPSTPEAAVLHVSARGCSFCGRRGQHDPDDFLVELTVGSLAHRLRYFVVHRSCLLGALAPELRSHWDAADLIPARRGA